MGETGRPKNRPVETNVFIACASGVDVPILR